MSNVAPDLRPGGRDTETPIWDDLKPGQILKIKSNTGASFWVTATEYMQINIDTVSNVAIQTSDPGCNTGGNPIGQRISRDLTYGERFQVNGTWAGQIKSVELIKG